MTGNPVDQRRCYRDQDPSGADYGVSYLGDKETADTIDGCLDAQPVS